MSTASATSKVLRGTKRVRLACEVRFYDQRRARILDPDEPLDPLGRAVYLGRDCRWICGSDTGAKEESI